MTRSQQLQVIRDMTISVRLGPYWTTTTITFILNIENRNETDIFGYQYNGIHSRIAGRGRR